MNDVIERLKEIRTRICECDNKSRAEGFLCHSCKILTEEIQREQNATN